MADKILMVVTSRGRLPNDTPTGVWLEELATPYWTFVDAGFDVVIASPAGGQAPLDPASTAEPWLTAAGKRFMADATAQGKLAATGLVERMQSSSFDAVFLVGGVGAAYDFPENDALASLIESQHRSAAVIAAICHGTLGIAAARTAGGESLVRGKQVTGFSRAEEEMMDLLSVVPAVPEERLRACGGIYSCAAAPFEAHVVRDGKVLTGQNPASADALALRVLQAIAERQ